MDGNRQQKAEPIHRLMEVLPRFELSGVLLHVSYRLDPDDLLYLPETHQRQWQAARQLYGAVPFASSLHLDGNGNTHAHDFAPIEAFPRLEAHIRAELAAGVNPTSLELSGRRLLALLDEHQRRPKMFARLVYDLNGLIDYVRVRPRVEVAKRSDSHRNPTDADLLDAAEFYLAMRCANGGRNPAASRIFNVPRRTPEELKAHRFQQSARRLEAAERRERRRLEHLEARRRLERLERLEAAERRAALVMACHVTRERLERSKTRRRLPEAVRHRTARCWPVPGRPVSRAACSRRPLLLGHARAPPRRKPRPGMDSRMWRGLSRSTDLDLSPEASPGKPTTPPR